MQCILMVISCGWLLNSQPVNTTIKPFYPDGDSVKTFHIPPSHKYTNFTSPLLQNWITSTLVAEEGSCDNPSAVALFDALEIPLITGLEKEVTAIYYRSGFQPDLYFIGSTIPCDPYGKVVMLFLMNKAEMKLVRFEAYWGEGCIGERNSYGGEFERFAKIGPYMAIGTFHTSFGMESSFYYIYNENLQEIGDLPQSMFVDQNNENPAKNIIVNKQYHYAYNGDTLIQHAIISITKGQKETTQTFDILYTCTPDSLYCISPAIQNKLDAYVKKYW